MSEAPERLEYRMIVVTLDDKNLPCKPWLKLEVHPQGIELTQRVIDNLQDFLDKWGTR